MSEVMNHTKLYFIFCRVLSVVNPLFAQRYCYISIPKLAEICINGGSGCFELDTRIPHLKENLTELWCVQIVIFSSGHAQKQLLLCGLYLYFYVVFPPNDLYLCRRKILTAAHLSLTQVKLSLVFKEHL